jgi:hypothetical protein
VFVSTEKAIQGESEILEQDAQQLLAVQVSVLTPKDSPVKFRDQVLQTAQPL